MADQSDVENGLAAIIANALYPNGAGAQTVLGIPCRIYRGLPSVSQLADDLRNGITHISVCIVKGSGKNTSRFPRCWNTSPQVLPTLSASVEGHSVTFSGVCGVGQLVGIGFSQMQFAYAVQENDSPATVASNLAGQIRDAGEFVDYRLATISMPDATGLIARIVSGASALKEIKRQEQKFEITMRCPDPASRDQVGSLLEASLGQIKFFPLSDGSSARLIYSETDVTDRLANANLYERALVYLVEYPTVIAEDLSAMLFGISTVREASSIVTEIKA